MEMRMKLSCAAACLGIALLSAPAAADVSVSAGNHVLQPEQGGQTISIFATGGDPVTALEFDVEIGENAAGPLITAIDLKTGTIFSDAAFIQTNVVTGARQAQSTVDGPNPVSASGLIANITFDTQGIPEGVYEFDLSGVAGAFNTTFFNGSSAVTTNITNGTITIVPEPASIGALTIAGLLLVRRTKGG